MPLHGVGLAKFLRTIKVYVGALYVDRGTKPEQVLGDVPKRLELSYSRSVEARDIARASEKNLADNVPQAMIAILRPRIDRMHRLYEDVKAGDRYALTYLPGIGTELTLNGQRKGVIEGADFAAAYFAIWLGPDPINQPLKEGLLTRRDNAPTFAGLACRAVQAGVPLRGILWTGQLLCRCNTWSLEARRRRRSQSRGTGYLLGSPVAFAGWMGQSRQGGVLRTTTCVE